MTIEEFNNTSWGAGMKIRYCKDIYEVGSVDFEEKLIGYITEIDECYSWARCENCEIVK